jgi:hypothetical protein
LCGLCALSMALSLKTSAKNGIFRCFWGFSEGELCHIGFTLDKNNIKSAKFGGFWLTEYYFLSNFVDFVESEKVSDVKDRIIACQGVCVHCQELVFIVKGWNRALWGGLSGCFGNPRGLGAFSGISERRRGRIEQGAVFPRSSRARGGRRGENNYRPDNSPITPR